MKPLLFLFSMAFSFSVSTAIFFIAHLVFSIQWLKRRDDCGISSLFMSLFSFAGTVYFALATAFTVVGCLITTFSKNFTMLNKSLVIAVAASMIFAIVEALTLIIAISAQMDTACLKKGPTKTYFVASWALIVVPIVVFSALILAIVFGRSYLVTFESSDHGRSPRESPYDYLWED
ncbi:hypothetical protein Y032_0068g211 [Ancylostoma ceylanicum]|uniref:Uncharacterized protein n=1 Tax=Ancylostoma ceylanicum TaxID=53326 RepID=A0A016TZC8_9BILA|nr:hypothetical protein Y032_0068g211 [Ancylostoma ceylanicum]